MKFTPVVKTQQFAEDNQALNIEFALAKKAGKDKFKGLTALSKCRDFLGDALFAEATKSKTSIYGFSYDGTGEAKLPKTYSCFAMKFVDKETQQKFKDNFQSYNTIFSILSGTKESKVYHDGLYTVIVADKAWGKNNFGVSLYTFLLKCVVLHKTWDDSLYHQVKTSTYTYTNWDGSTKENPTNESKYLQKIPEELYIKAITYIKQINKCPTTFGGSSYEGVKFNSNIHHSSGWVYTLTYKDNEFWKILDKQQEK